MKRSYSAASFLLGGMTVLLLAFSVLLVPQNRALAEGDPPAGPGNGVCNYLATCDGTLACFVSQPECVLLRLQTGATERVTRTTVRVANV
jgi:hypothetical protein